MSLRTLMRRLVCSVCGNDRQDHPELAFYASEDDVRCQAHAPSAKGYAKLEPIAEHIDQSLEEHRELYRRLAKL